MSYSRAAVLLVAAVFILRPAPSFAPIEEIRIAVDGLTCNLCSVSLERSLRRLDGVATVDIAFDEAIASVTLKAGAAFDADKIRTAVRNSGQKPRQIDLRLSGVVQRHEGGYRLQPDGGLPLGVAPASAAAVASHVGKVVRARARVSSPDGAPVELALTDVVAR